MNYQEKYRKQHKYEDYSINQWYVNRLIKRESNRYEPSDIIYDHFPSNVPIDVFFASQGNQSNRQTLSPWEFQYPEKIKVEISGNHIGQKHRFYLDDGSEIVYSKKSNKREPGWLIIKHGDIFTKNCNGINFPHPKDWDGVNERIQSISVKNNLWLEFGSTKTYNSYFVVYDRIIVRFETSTFIYSPKLDPHITGVFNREHIFRRGKTLYYHSRSPYKWHKIENPYPDYITYIDWVKKWRGLKTLIDHELPYGKENE